MRRIPYAVAGLMAAALVAIAVGWYLSAAAGYEGRFESCRFEGTTVVLTYQHGTNQSVEPFVDARDGEVVVNLWKRSEHRGPHTAIAILGEVRHHVGGTRAVRYLDGTPLPCPER